MCMFSKIEKSAKSLHPTARGTQRDKKVHLLINNCLKELIKLKNNG